MKKTMKPCLASHMFLVLIFTMPAIAEDSFVSPDVIYPDKENIQLSREIVSEQDDEKEIIVVGNAAVGTEVTGKACVITSKRQLKRVSQGDIVVAPAIHSSWYPLLSQAAGIIIEKGDGASHALLLGKKLDIPVIVGASGATKKIIDGEIITLDPVTKNVYHVAYPESHEVHFDRLTLQQKDEDQQSLAFKLAKAHMRPWQSVSSQSSEHHELYPDMINSCLGSREITKQKTAKEIYLSDFNRFKDYVFKMKSELYMASWLPDTAFRVVAEKKFGCSSFAIDCIDFARAIFKHSDRYIMELMRDVANNLEDIDLIIEECNKKPGDLNKVAEVCHKVNVNSVILPPGVDKQVLVDEPKKYMEIEKRFANKSDQAQFNKQRDMETMKGLYIRFVVEVKKIYRNMLG